MRHAARRDLNDTEITAAVRAAGFSVLDFGKAGCGIPDKLVTKPLPQIGEDGAALHFACWLEIKSKNGKLKDNQLIFKTIFESSGQWLEGRDAKTVVDRLQSLYDAKIKPEACR